MGFKKNQISSQNTKVLAFVFIKKHQIVAKTDRNSVFLGCEAHIPYRVHIMVMFIHFYGFLNN
jgi:hypothetical protein